MVPREVSNCCVFNLQFLWKKGNRWVLSSSFCKTVGQNVNNLGLNLRIFRSEYPTFQSKYLPCRSKYRTIRYKSWTFQIQNLKNFEWKLCPICRIKIRFFALKLRPNFWGKKPNIFCKKANVFDKKSYFFCKIYDFYC